MSEKDKLKVGPRVDDSKTFNTKNVLSMVNGENADADDINNALSQLASNDARLNEKSGGDVKGPNSSVVNNVTVFSDATGKVIKDSGLPFGNIVTNAAVSVIDAIATFSDTTGKIIKSSGKTLTDIANDIATAVGTKISKLTTGATRSVPVVSDDGSSISRSLLTVDNNGTANIPTGQTYNINGVTHGHPITTPSAEGFCPKLNNNANTCLQGDGQWGTKSSGGGGDVTGPAGGVVNNEIVVYNETTGKIIKSSGGKTVGGLETSIAAKVAGIASSVADNIMVFADATGKLVKDSGKKVSDLAAASVCVDNLIPGTNITLTPSGNKVTIAASGGGGGGYIQYTVEDVGNKVWATIKANKPGVTMECTPGGTIAKVAFTRPDAATDIANITLYIGGAPFGTTSLDVDFDATG